MTTFLSWRVGFLMEVVIIAIVLINIKLVRDVAYTGPRKIDTVGAALSIVGMGGIVLGILVWQEGGEFVLLIMAVGAVALGALAYWLIRRKREGKVALLDPDLFKVPNFRVGVSQVMLQQITIGGAMIALPLYLQVTLEYNAMQAGLSMAPLSLTMFAVALLAGKRAGKRRPASIIRMGFGLALVGMVVIIPVIPRGESGLVASGPTRDRRHGPWPSGLAAQQLHPGPHRGGTGQRGRRSQLRRQLLRPVVRIGDRGRHPSGGSVDELRQHDRVEHSDPTGRSGADRRPCWRTMPSS